MRCRKASARESLRGSSSPQSRDESRPTPPATRVRRKPFCARPTPSIPLQGSLLPHVDEPDQQNRDEDQHFSETEERNVTDRADIIDERHEAGKLFVVDRPWNHEHSLDVEDYEQDRDEIKPYREALTRIAESGLA